LLLVLLVLLVLLLLLLLLLLVLLVLLVVLLLLLLMLLQITLHRTSLTTVSFNICVFCGTCACVCVGAAPFRSVVNGSS
jgi:hypothetical protein